MIQRVCLFFDRTYVDAHPCFREMANEFLKKGWEVDLYTGFYPSQTVPCFRSDKLRLFFVGRSKRNILEFLFRTIFKRRYHLIVANPPWALYWAVRVGTFLNIPVVCLSDEVYSWDEIFYLTQNKVTRSLRKWIRREKWAHRRCALTVSLSDSRFQNVKEKNKLSDAHPYAVIPNAPAGQSEKWMSSFYREMLGVPKDRVLLLHSGGLSWQFIKSLVESTSHWDSQFTLVLQSRIKVTEMDLKESSNVKFCPITLPGEMMRYATSSADIGLMLYNQSSFIEAVNGATAGKLGLYLSCGLPIICCNLDSLKWVDQEGCGIWVSDVNLINEAAKKIMTHYDIFSRNAVRVFNERFEYSKHFEVFMDRLRLTLGENNVSR